jgi:molecular chaperone DnaJ
MGKDYYKILGVEKNVSAEEIKKAFRKKAHEYHPDKAGGNEEKFKEVSEAYHVLNNPEKRKQYDQFGTTFEGAGGFGNGAGWADFVRQAGFGNTGGFSGGINIDDLGDLFGDFFGGGFGRSSARTGRHSKGADMEIQLSISLLEAVFGVSKTISLNKEVVCDKCRGNGAEPGSKINECKKCHGSGQITSTSQTFFGAFRSVSACGDCGGEGKVPEKKCSACHGFGKVKGKEKIKINIPAGIKSGETMRLSGSGGAGEKGQPSGDLYVVIEVLPDPQFKRAGDDLFTKKTIKLTQAILGDKVKVKTLDGEVNLKIPAGSYSGKQFVIYDKGSHKLRGRGRGDLIVEIKVDVPDKLSRSQKKLVEELKEEGL